MLFNMNGDDPATGFRSGDRETGVLWCLERFDLLQELSDRQRAVLREHVQIEQYDKGEPIYLPGDPGDTIYFLTQGRVKLSHLDPSGNRLTLHICGRGEPFGETALSGEGRRTLIAEALDEVELCAIDKRDLLRFAEENAVFSLGITKLIGRQLREIETRLEDLVFKDIETRLTRVLYRLSQHYGQQTDAGIRIEVYLTHHELAHLIGSTRETTSTMLGKLASEGIVEKGRQHLDILDPEALRQKAQL